MRDDDPGRAIGDGADENLARMHEAGRERPPSDLVQADDSRLHVQRDQVENLAQLLGGAWAQQSVHILWTSDVDRLRMRWVDLTYQPDPSGKHLLVDLLGVGRGWRSEVQRVSRGSRHRGDPFDWALLRPVRAWVPGMPGRMGHRENRLARGSS